jgi:hypothetical protein
MKKRVLLCVGFGRDSCHQGSRKQDLNVVDLCLLDNWMIHVDKRKR